MLRCVLLVLAFATSTALQLAPLRPVRGAARRSLVVCSGEGFGGGAPKPASKPKKKKKSKAVAAPPPTAVAPTLERSELNDAEARGRKMLEEMWQSSGEPVFRKQNQLILTEEEKRPLDPTEGVMPEEVADRMLARIIPFTAAPIGLGVFVFIGFWFANTQLQMDLPPSIVAYATQACLLLSFAGITYGVMSTNLEEGAEQTLLGAENLKRNVDVMRSAEDERIAMAKLEQEEDDARRDGVLLKARDRD